MKLCVIALIITSTLLLIHCTKDPYEIHMIFTSPSGQSMPHGGFYKIESTGDSIGMYGQTPNEYVYTLEHDDVMLGAYWKDTTEAQDTLHFELYVNGEVKINEYLTDPYQGGEFRVPEIGEEP